MLPIEGVRTFLPSPVRPQQTANLNVRLVAPDETGNFAVRITLVQEGVAWFMTKSNTYLELPVAIR